MSQVSKPKTKTYEFNAVLQDIHRRKKGSSAFKSPHTTFTVITREITEDEMDALVHGGCNGNRICLKIEVVEN